MPKFTVTSPSGDTFDVNAPDGATEADAIAYVQKNFTATKADKPSVPFGQQMNKAISDIPRQIGLTARHGIEGVGDTLDMLASPIRAGLNALGANIQGRTGQSVSDLIGLPTPQNDTERVVGDTARLMAGSAIPIGAAGQIAKVATGATKAVANTLASNPANQLLSAGSAGAAGGYTRETGGNEVSQLAAALAAGVASPMAANKLGSMATSAKDSFTRMTTPAAVRQADQQITINVAIDNALKDSGLKMADLPAQIQAGLRADVAQALDISKGNLSPDAIRRLADYRMTGATPTAGGLTLDPAIVSQQKNLAKIGINSKDSAAQQLGQVENANNRQLITGLNSLGANTADDALAGGQKIMGALSQRNDTAKSLIGARYDAARASTGRSAALDPSAFTQNANNLLDDALLGGKLPADVRNLLNKSAQGEMPLTVDVAEQFKTRIGDLQRASSDRMERKALGLVRQALDDTPLLDGQGQAAIDAFNSARRLNRSWMQIVEKTPALQAVRDGIEPDKFVQQFIIGSGGKANVMDVAALKSSIKRSPEAMQAVQQQIVASLKKSALNGAADEVGNFSQSAYNKALQAIGERKLKLFFKPEEVQQMKAIGRVASYEQFQPRGAAVNNSNTAGAALANILDRVGGSPLLSKIPFGSMLADPMKNISTGMMSKRTMDVPLSLAGKPAQLPRQQIPGGLLMSPMILMNPEERNRQGLLTQ